MVNPYVFTHRNLYKGFRINVNSHNFNQTNSFPIHQIMQVWELKVNIIVKS